MRRKTVLFEHTRDTFTPIAESGQFRPSGWVGARDGLTIFCKIPIMLIVLTTRPWPVRKKNRTGTSRMVSHTRHNNEPTLSRTDSPPDCLHMTLAYRYYFCMEETWEHFFVHWYRVITCYERIASCARTQLRSRASESQGNSATRYYAEFITKNDLVYWTIFTCMILFSLLIK